MSEFVTIPVSPLLVTKQALWDAVVNSGAEIGSCEVMFHETDFENFRIVLTALDGESDRERKQYTLTLDDVVKAFGKAVDTKATHCGGCRIDDLDDPDACTGDWLIQQAIYGEEVYG